MSETRAVESEGEFFALARALGAFKAGPLQGEPPDRALAREAGVSATTVGAWLRGERFPQELDKVLALVRRVAAVAAARGLAGQDRAAAGLLDEQRWRAAHHEEARQRAGAVSAGVRRAQAAAVLAGLGAGRPLAEVSDPFALEVHRPVQPDSPQDNLPVLPAYVRRKHDDRLDQVAAAAAGGCSSIAVLVGGSSTGKTRACWEALQVLRSQKPQWRLWHPIDPSRPEAALRELPAIGPRTVVWLNEAQFYLDVRDGGVGEWVAAGLRELLRDPVRRPVLVLATIWPSFWDGLTARPASGGDPHAQARELLAGHDITVPGAFTDLQLERLREAGDVRLAQAAAAAQDGQIIQYLAGVPELLARYRNAPPAAQALIHAAMDARLLGMRPALPYAFLAAAAPGYLADSEWDQLGDDWLEAALAFTAAPCKGVRGPLTRIRPRPAGADGSPARHGAEPGYRLADYLDQYGRRARAGQIPPAAFWAAAGTCADPGDLRALGDAARSRGLYRVAAQLAKRATALGDPAAAGDLVRLMHRLDPASQQPADWAAAHAALDDPAALARLLYDLQGVGAMDQIATLADRAAAHAALDDPYAVAVLLHALRMVKAGDQVTILASRAVGQAPLDDPGDVARLLAELRAAKAEDQIATLLSRYPSGQAAPGGPGAGADPPEQPQDDTARLLERMIAHMPLDAELLHLVATQLEAVGAQGARGSIAPLLDRTIARISPQDPHAVGRLLHGLWKTGASPQIAGLLKRDPAAHAALHDPYGVATLLGALREAGAESQAAGLLKRDPAAHAALHDPYGVAALLDALHEAGAQDQVTELLRRDPAAHAALDDPVKVAVLVGALQEVGALDQATTLAGRAATQVSVSDPRAVATLLGALQDAGAEEQVTTLAGRAAAGAPVCEPAGVIALLGALREAGADNQVTILAGRAAARTPIGDLHAVARLLGALREAGAENHVTALAGRAAAHSPVDNPYDVAMLLDELRETKAKDQATILADRAASHAPLAGQAAIARLLTALQQANTAGQAAALIERLPAAGMFNLFCEQADRQDRFRFGREADGSPAGQWSWQDLD
jgi:hypothetical protein